MSGHDLGRTLKWHEAVVPPLQPLAGGALAIGTFDGVHLGHQAIVARMCRDAQTVARRVAVLTFHPHPRRVLTPDRPPRLLTSLAERVEQLRAAGSPELKVGVLRFTQSFAQLGPAEFVEEVLVARLEAGSVYVGYDFAFGRGRSGDVTALRRLGGALGLDVVVIPPVEVDGRVVSSSRIRRQLRSGRPAEAARLLGRPYRLSGRVVPGEGRGGTLGFPTANLQLPAERLVPEDGVYMVDVLGANGDRRWLGVCNIGRRPTFGGGSRQVEVHLLDFSGELYDRLLTVHFLERLRDERLFAGPEPLRAQLMADVLEVRRRRSEGG